MNEHLLQNFTAISRTFEYCRVNSITDIYLCSDKLIVIQLLVLKQFILKLMFEDENLHFEYSDALRTGGLTLFEG